MRFVIAVLFPLLLAMPVGAASREITLYLDGALLEQEFTASSGLIEIYLPASMSPSSLRIKPIGGSSIERVEILPVKPDRKQSRELTKLAKQRDVLSDRLQALDAREAIFKAAAKSQSGKSPRKTKSNPDPMTAMRQGTEFAMAQLEKVYRGRRLTEAELKAVEARLAAMNKGQACKVARVRMSGKSGRLVASYLLSDLKWIPVYDFRLDRPGEADVVLRALLPKLEHGTVTKVVPATLKNADGEPPFPVPSQNFPQLAVFNFRIDRETYDSSPVSSTTFSFTNSSARKLPGGEVSCYRRGEFLGKAMFGGLLPGASSTMVFGNM